MRSFAMDLVEVVLTAFLAGCSLQEGTVVNKEYRPERKWVQIYPLVLCNKDNVHKGKIPVLCVDDEGFIIDVKEKNGVNERFYLRTRQLNDQYPIGSFFKYNPKIAKRSDPIVKRRLTEEEWERLRRNGY